MKGENVLAKIVGVALFLGVLAFIGWVLYDSLVNGPWIN